VWGSWSVSVLEPLSSSYSSYSYSSYSYSSFDDQEEEEEEEGVRLLISEYLYVFR
jgi:hypothetical protein